MDPSTPDNRSGPARNDTPQTVSPPKGPAPSGPSANDATRAHTLRAFGGEPDEAMVDSLADLFLGEGPLAPGSASSGRHLPGGLDAATPPLRLTTHDDIVWPDADHDPALSAKHAVRNRDSQFGTAAHPRQSGRGTDQLSAAPKAHIEAIVLGHLPVIAPAWAQQYAGHRARELDQLVVLARLANGTVTIELLGEQVEQPPVNLEACSTLAAALRRAASVARYWIIRVDEVSEASLAEASGLDTITVLTGADDAAVVACYRALKALAFDTSAAQGEDEKAPELAVAIMGASERDADDAERKLRQTSRAFLGRPDLVAARLPRMMPVQSTTLFRGPCHEPAPVFIAAVRSAAAEPHTLPEFPPRPPVNSTRREPGLSSSDAKHSHSFFQHAGPVDSVTDRYSDAELDLPRAAWANSTDTQSFAANRTNSPANSQPSGFAPHEDLWTEERESSVPSPIALIGGLQALGFGCPFAPGVELAVDAQGGLHLIVLDSDERNVVGDLMATRAWTLSHASLLAAAEPRISMPIMTTLHLMTDRPAMARGLLDTEVRVHLLAYANMSSGGWVARSLNGA